MLIVIMLSAVVPFDSYAECSYVLCRCVLTRGAVYNAMNPVTVVKWSIRQAPSGLYYKTITIVIMMIVVTLQIVESLTIVIDETS
jgi:hypothetical protein